MIEKRTLIPPLLAILLLSVALLTGCAGRPRPTTWTDLTVAGEIAYVADLEHVRALLTSSGAEQWHFPEEAGGPFYTLTLLPEQMLFVTSHERMGGGFFSQPQGVLRAISINGSGVLWTFTEAKGEYIARGAVGDGIFVIGNSDGNVYALHVEDGSPAWPQPFHTDGRVWGTPLILSDTVYVASLDHNLYAIDLETGVERWRFTAGGAMVGPPLALGDRLYIGAFDRTLYALGREDGVTEWAVTFEDGDWIWGTPASDGTTVYVADVKGHVYAVDAESGARRWKVSLEEPVRLGPVLDETGAHLLVGSDSGSLFNLDPTDGSVRWSRPEKGPVAALDVEGDIIYVARIYADAHVQALRITDGEVLWTFQPPETEE